MGARGANWIPYPKVERMIRVEHITKRFGRFTALDDLSFSVEDGEAVALWGPNGAGKTTAIRCVLGLLRFGGRAWVAGHDVRRRGKAARRAIGYVPQELSFYDDLRATEALRLFARLKRAPGSRAGVVLEEVGLGGHGRKRVRELSGGMKQRLALASALLADPPLLVLDELTSNLDAGAQAGFTDLLRELKGRGKTILFSSHRVEEVRALADRVLLLDAGRLVRAATPEDFRAAEESLTLKIVLAEGSLDAAVAALSRRGFDAARNGSSVRVPVSASAKARPLTALHEARIDVINFELGEGGEGSAFGKGDGRG